jgi:pimeloyl-ACP methyl ester carboxylesterase
MCWLSGWKVRLFACVCALGAALAGCASLPGDQTASGATGHVEISELAGAAPTVVFESGLGAYKESWGEVFNDIGRTHSVFAYDRPGIGKSQATDRPRDGATIVEDLRALLKSRDLNPPYVLVGHSLGGLYVQVYARRYPAEVAGLVLVDPTHPTQFEGAGALERRGVAASALMGVYEMFGPVRSEFDALPQTGREVLSAPPPPRKLPIVILVAPDRSGSEMAAFDNAKRADYARLYPGADYREVEGGHRIPSENPKAVIDAIRKVLASASSRRS